MASSAWRWYSATEYDSSGSATSSRWWGTQARSSGPGLPSPRHPAVDHPRVGGDDLRPQVPGQLQERAVFPVAVAPTRASTRAVSVSRIR